MGKFANEGVKTAAAVIAALSATTAFVALEFARSFSLTDGWQFIATALTAGFVPTIFAAWLMQTKVKEKQAFVLKAEQFLTAFNHLPHGMVIFSQDKHLVYANDRYTQMYRLDPSEIYPGMPVEELRSVRRKHDLPLLEDGKSFKIPYAEGKKEYVVEIWKLGDGRTIRVAQFPIESGGWVAQHKDITAELEQQKALDEARQFLDMVVDHVPDPIIVKDAYSLEYKLVNRAVERIIGLPKEEIIGKYTIELFPPDQAQVINNRDRAALEEEGEEIRQREEVVETPGNGERVIQSKRLVVRNTEGDPTHLLTVAQDKTEKRKTDARIQFLAMHDPLTGLYNRAWFNEKLANELEDLKQGDEIALVLLDLDGFKEINDTFGHAAGDLLLQTISARMTEPLDEDVKAARLGGDEFAIVTKVRSTHMEMISRLEAIHDRISAAVEYEGQRMSVRASIGVTFAGAGTVDAETLARQADVALYEAKEAGKARLCVFNPQMMARRLKRKTIECNLRDAIGTEQFKLHYQPIINTQSGEIVSMEALLRWHHPEHGMIPPNEFIPIAEETGLIVPIGERVLEMACETAMQWPESIRISVNLSPVQFRDLNLGAKIADIIARTGIKPHRLEVEITEATLLSDDSASLKTLNELRETGVRVVMDDFGTGYSSLNYIRSFPFDKIKIDKSYVDGLLERRDNSHPILHAVFSLAKTLNLSTTAEGVETRAQMDLLREEGCTEMQGYYFSKPIPDSEIAAFLEKQAREWAKVA